MPYASTLTYAVTAEDQQFTVAEAPSRAYPLLLAVETEYIWVRGVGDGIMFVDRGALGSDRTTHPAGAIIGRRPPDPSALAGGAGSPGPAGCAGAPGVDGAPGTAGVDGAAGPPGADGATGAAGIQGLPGPAGSDGAAGLAGTAGARGVDGAQGLPGNDGANGTAGADSTVPGPQGAPGAAGATGPQGPQGNPGTPGVQGDTGTPGADGTGVPAGVIVMWGGLLVNIPAGWALCNGANGTPDLRGLFVKGAAAGANPGATGGATTHTHAAHTGVVTHTHPVNVTDGGHSHLTQRYPTATGTSSGFTMDTSMSGTLADNTLPTKSATTGITAASTAPAGAVAELAHDTPNSEPPYYALAYIQKVA